MMNTLIQNIDYMKYFIIYGVVIPTSLTMTYKGQKYMYFDYNIRNYGNY